jgi:hypothetical protein
MALTSKLGTGDSLLANVELAFAGAAPSAPAITTQSGQLGGQLGATILALAGAEGPLTFNVSAESVLTLAQAATSDPTFAAHSTPDWVLGGHDSQLGGLVPAFDDVPAARPTPTTQSGLLGTALGKVVIGLDGVGGPRVFHLSAENSLAIAQTAEPTPTFAPHSSPRWVLGGQDSCLGGVMLASAGPADARPLTGSLTGKLGTANSLLGGVRLALGLQEGEGTAAFVYADAASELSLSQTAAAAVARPATAESVVSLTDAAGRNKLLSVSAASPISLTDAADRNNLLDASALSTLNVDTAAGFSVARAMAASSNVPMTDAAGFKAVRSLSAESVVALTDAAEMTGRTVFDVATESSLGLGVEAGFTVAYAVAASNTLDLDSAAGRNNILCVGAESAISLTGTAVRNQILPVSAESILSLGATAEQVGRLLEAAAESPLSLSDAASAIKTAVHNAECWDWVFLYDEATVSVVRKLSARSTINLVQTEHTARPWHLSADSRLQTVSYQYDQATDTFYPVYEGLRDSAHPARPLAASVHQAISLAQLASAVRVKPTAISVSAESVLDLLGEVRLNQTGGAGNWLALGQSATVNKCKIVRSVLDLSQAAAVLVSVPRGAASALSLQQAAAYTIVSRGALQRYSPFVGAGADGSPTPPPPLLEAPEHVALPFQLFYPAEGVLTDSVVLRAPNFGNKDRLAFNRILRETRGGTLIVFADPIWPKIQTLVLTFSGLRNAQTRQLLAFLDAHLGEEIGLLDWEGRTWKGIITTPADPVVQDGKDSYTASMEFEGELVPA